MITAEEAYTLSKDNNNRLFDEFLCRVITEINNASHWGNTSIKMWYGKHPIDKYIEVALRIKDYLEIYGYKVRMTKFWSRNLFISWNKEGKTIVQEIVDELEKR